MHLTLQGRPNGLSIAVLSASFLAAFPVRGQIVPDTTLPVDSVLVPNGSTAVIEGGTVAGSNLFHSFSEFSVPTGSAAVFNNGAGIDNILSRVTGGNLSNIDGLVSANGNANLFLLNPNGIVFGPNARLDLGGSFFATSAESVLFADGVEFRAANPEIDPLLTVSVPSGLQFGEAPGAIVNRSTVDRGEIVSPLDAIGLQVSGSTLALVGGEVRFEGGAVSTGGGRIELGSLGSNQVVGIEPADGGLGLNYEGVNLFGDLRFSDGAIANSSGDPNGPIQVRARSWQLDNSQIVAFNTGSRSGGDLDIHASRSVEFVGDPNQQIGSEVSMFLAAAEVLDLADLPTGMYSFNLATGGSGNITVTTPQLTIRQVAFLSTRANGSGRAGDIVLDVPDAIEIRASLVTSNSSFESTGDTGNILVNTRRLSLPDSGRLISEVFGPAGNGGNVTVNASESIEVLGIELTRSATGSGNALIGTGSETLTGNAGDVRLSTEQLTVRGGGAVLATAIGGRRPGNIFIQARSIDLAGTSRDESAFPSSIFAGSFAPSDLSVAGGNITLDTEELTVRDGARLFAINFAPGTEGNITIDANSVTVENETSIDTETAFGEGGDITLRTERLLLDNEAEIHSSVGLTINPVTGALLVGTGGNGGNLMVDADTIVALNNSDIFTQSLDDRGGRINIEADGIFGLQLRETLTNDSDIVPESRVNLEDVETVTSPDIDPQEYLVDFDVAPLNRNLFALNCTATDGSANPWQEATQWGMTSSGKVVLVTGDETETAGWEGIECDS